MRRRILLVRHCQSEANAEGRIEGRGDSPLSPIGRDQAKAVAAFIAAMEVEGALLLASDQARARATAAEIGAACGWTTHAHDPRVREGDLGWMEDMAYTDIAKHMAENQLKELNADVHGGESLETVAARFWEALDEVLRAHDGAVVVVSHGYTIQALLRRFDPEVAVPRFIGNGDVVEVWLEDETFSQPPRHHPLQAPA